MAQSGDGAKTTVVLSEANPGSASELRAMLARLISGGQQLTIAGYARDGLEVAQMAAHTRPDIIFVDVDMPGIDGFEACKLAVAANPDTLCVMVIRQADAKSISAAMRAGARAVFDPHQSENELRELIDQLIELRKARQKPEFAIATDPEKLPVSIAVTGAKDGIGKTMLATNLGAVLAKRYPRNVAVVDFFGQFGNVALSLDLSYHASIQDLLGYQELDVELVESHLVAHECGLRVLPGISRGDQEEMSQVEIPQLATLLGMLRRRNRFTLFDLPPLLWPASPYVLSRCQQIIVLVTLDDIALMRDTASLIEIIIKGNVPSERIKLVVNRASKSTEFGTSDIEETTGLKVWAEIPDQFAVVSTARNEGVPFVLGRPRESVSVAIDEIARKIILESTPRTVPGGA